MRKKLTLSQSLFWILASAVAINALAYFGIKGALLWKKIRGIDHHVPIRAIVQTGPQKEALKTAYLAELLDLSEDRPTLSSDFDVKEAEKKLRQSPVISEACVKIQEPGILYIDYTIRQPVAFLLDYENVALDKQGYPFPVAPFFTPKKLPGIYLGMEEELHWSEPIQGEKLKLAFELLELINGPIVGELFNVKRIDVSNAFEMSYGRREIVLFTQDEIYKTIQGKEVRFVIPRVLRLPTKKYSQELANYLKFREQRLEKEKQELNISGEGQTVVLCPLVTIDLRIPQLAFIDEGRK
ncbi:MAG: hypothetical protein JSS30_07415 [Verrucomicrobia bacterium]|nr:hypothetical protein [Verrucomicrobiota bacterium]